VIGIVGIPSLSIFLEKLAYLLAGNAFAAILNPNPNTPRLSEICADLYLSAIASKFDGVTD
jgi:hypothetical protein